MEVQQDFKELLELFNAHNVEFAALDLSSNDFSSPEKVVQLGVPPVRIDIITSITGLTWEQIAPNRVNGTYGNVSVYYIGKQEFIANKKAISRHKDLADIEALGEKID